MSYVALSPAELAEWTPYKQREFRRRMPQSWKLMQYRIDMAKLHEADRHKRRKQAALKRIRFDRTRHWDVICRTLMIRERRRVCMLALVGRAERIMNITAKIALVGINDMRSTSRRRHISEARMAAAWLMRKYTRLSSPEIGRRFGGRDHSTILHAHKVVDQDLASGGLRFGTLIASVEARLLATN